MSDYEDQHFVQKRYLEFFSRDNRLWVFDKYLNKIFSQSPKKVAYEKHFYELPTAKLKNGSNVPLHAVERALHEPEGMFAESLQKLIEGLDKYGFIDQQQKRGVAFFVVMQRVRTREYRQAIAQLQQNFYDASMRALFTKANRRQWLDDRMRTLTGGVSIAARCVCRRTHQSQQPSRWCSRTD